ncbi:hypothetical protein K3495_g9314 [Podosphaera aphanis]|nr:hypothetical protein K3495_g9314 [Podosphaera aphanis]
MGATPADSIFLNTISNQSPDESTGNKKIPNKFRYSLRSTPTKSTKLMEENYFYVNGPEIEDTTSFEVYLLTKEKADLELSIKRRDEGIINTPGKSFELSDREEFESLIKNGVIKLEKFDQTKHGNLRLFNSRLVHYSVDLGQNGGGKKIGLNDASLGHNSTIKHDLAANSTIKKAYIQQRARGAYFALICQPEACYELSGAAQIQNPSRDHITKLNGKLSWQKNNLERGLKKIPLDLKVAKLYVFVDASFANNADLSSRIGFVIVLANEIKQENHKFSINGNIVHYSSTKSKRVTRSVLASEVYGMVGGVDMGYAIATTINLIFS